MTYSARTRKSIALRAADPFQQFGQTDDERTRNGADGCTDTVLQYLARLWTGRRYSQDQIRGYAGIYTTLGRGLYPHEVQRVCDRLGLPYQVRFNLTAFQMLTLSARGPIGFGHKYDWWPEERGHTYFGVKADGYPNGYATPYGAAGRTQLSGFSGAHFGLLIGWDPVLGDSARRVVGWEPNHNSPSRPENPPYDQMTSGQFRRVYESYQKKLGRTPYALVPTRNLPL